MCIVITVISDTFGRSIKRKLIRRRRLVWNGTFHLKYSF